MPLQKTWARLPFDSATDIVIVVDASESAADHQTQIANLVRQLLDLLPASCQPRVYFLGNPKCYPANAFATRSREWFAENRQRASLISPILVELAKSCLQRIVVVGSGSIFDLADWRHSPLASRLLLVSPGQSLQDSAEVFCDEQHTSDAQHVLPLVHDPITSVTLSGPGFMPTWWDNSAYQMEMNKGRAILRNSSPESVEINFSALSKDPTSILAVVKRASGSTDEYALLTRDPMSIASNGCGTLTPVERRAFLAARRRSSFICPRCGHEQAWDVVRCKRPGQILGEPIYPSITSSNGTKNSNGFTVFQEGWWRVHFHPHPVPVLQISEQRVAVANSGIHVYAYDPAADCWQEDPDAFQQYQEIGKNACAIYV